jgi:hypothetical protein
MLRFKVLSKVHGFHFKGRRYFPGEIVECSEEDAALFNLDFLESVPETAQKVEVSVSDVVNAVALLEPEVKVDELFVHPEGKRKVKPRVLPKVQP